MIRRFATACVLGCAMMLSFAVSASDVPETAPVRMAVTGFNGHVTNEFNDLSAEAMIGRQIVDTVLSDLKGSGAITPIDPDGLTAVEEAMDRPPMFGIWRNVAANFLTQISVSFPAPERLRVQYRMWDIGHEQHMEARSYTTMPSNWQRVGHIISDSVYKRITGKDGNFCQCD